MAAGILLLVEDGKLSLDDKLNKYLPDLTRSSEISIRQILSHTSGYRNFTDRDYLIPAQKRDASVDKVLAGSAKVPLNFDPGTRYQYSNTNYVIAGKLLEKVSGQSLIHFLRERIFTPLKMDSVVDIASENDRLQPDERYSYERFALGPWRVAELPGKGWAFGAGDLAMSAEDMARWNESMMNEKLLRPSSYREMQKEVLLANGQSSGYGLGVRISNIAGSRSVQHSGGIAGFISSQLCFTRIRRSPLPY